MSEFHHKKEVLSNRRRSRELALCTLYAYEIDNNGSPEVTLARIAATDELAISDYLLDKIKAYASKLVGACLPNLEAIDARISEKAANWEMRRMAAVDRNVLRLAVAELVHSDEEVPYKVVIDEAVEIAKRYGTDDSGKFVNGILDSIRKDITKKAGG